MHTQNYCAVTLGIYMSHAIQRWNAVPYLTRSLEEKQASYQQRAMHRCISCNTEGNNSIGRKNSSKNRRKLQNTREARGTKIPRTFHVLIENIGSALQVWKTPHTSSAVLKCLPNTSPRHDITAETIYNAMRMKNCLDAYLESVSEPVLSTPLKTNLSGSL